MKLAQGKVEDLSEYLGSGSNGSAFSIEVDGEIYAAKFSRILTQVNFEIKPLIRARGIPHTSQLVSYSFEDSVVIMELLPGTVVTDFTPEDAPEYSDENIIQLIDTVRELDANGLVIDPKASNFMYDKEQGFSVLDYHLKQAGGNYGLPQEIISLQHALTAGKFAPQDYKTPYSEENGRTWTIGKYKVILPLMIRLLAIMKEKYPGILVDWQQQHDEAKKNPNIRVGEMIRREEIPKHPDLDVYLKKLEEMGF